MAKYTDVDALMRLIPMEETVARMAISNAQPVDEEKIAREYCMKHFLVMISMDSYEKLIASYNRGTGGLLNERRGNV